MINEDTYGLDRNTLLANVTLDANSLVAQGVISPTAAMLMINIAFELLLADETGTQAIEFSVSDVVDYLGASSAVTGYKYIKECVESNLLIKHENKGKPNTYNINFGYNSLNRA